MTEQTDAKRQPHFRPGHIACILLVVFVLYPLSAFPVNIALHYLVASGLISKGPAEIAFLTIYAPVGWAVDGSSAVERGFRFLGKPFEAVPLPPSSR